MINYNILAYLVISLEEMDLLTVPAQILLEATSDDIMHWTNNGRYYTISGHNILAVLISCDCWCLINHACNEL